MSPAYVTDIEEMVEENEYFRRVLFTSSHSQLVVMSLKPGEEIGLETHPDVDQFIRIEKGLGQAILGGTRHALEDGSAIVIPAGTSHNIVNTSDTKSLKLYTLYSPPHHPEGTIHENKDQAEASELAEAVFRPGRG